jgi:hypothetical protein
MDIFLLRFGHFFDVGIELFGWGVAASCALNFGRAGLVCWKGIVGGSIRLRSLIFAGSLVKLD